MSDLLSYFHNMVDIRLVLFTQRYSPDMQKAISLLNKDTLCGDFSKSSSFYNKGLYLDRLDVNEFYYINYHTTIGKWFVKIMLKGDMHDFAYLLDAGLLCFVADPDYMPNTNYISDYTAISLASKVVSEFVSYRIRHIGKYRFAIYGVSKTAKIYYITFELSEVFLKKVNSQLDFGLSYDQPILVHQ